MLARISTLRSGQSFRTRGTFAVPCVILDGVTKTFAGPGGVPIEAVSGLNLQVEDGECLALVGPSGSGKTTVLRLIAGLETPTSGTIRIGQTVVNEIAPKGRNVAMVFQNPALYPHLSVSENLGLGLRLRNCARSEVDERVTNVAAMLEITDCLNSTPAGLSGGQRQRVAIGRAVVRRAAVLLLDEPLANVEPGLRARLRNDLFRLRQECGATMIYVTHDHSEALMVGNRVAVLRKGVLQQVADPIGLYQAPANLFVAGFIGSPGMNFFPGMLHQRGSHFVFEPRKQTEASLAPKYAESVLNLPAGLVSRAEQGLGRPVVLGIRPEQVHIANGKAMLAPGSSVQARIMSVENAGADTFVHAGSDAGEFVARLPASTRVCVGEETTFVLNLGSACIFDAGTGRALD